VAADPEERLGDGFDDGEAERQTKCQGSGVADLHQPVPVSLPNVSTSSACSSS
jgi:hypothetical protein